VASQAQARYEMYSGFMVDDTPVLPSTETHPSLYFGADALETLRARRTEAEYSGLWADIRGDAATFIGRTAASQDENDRPQMAKTLAFYWLMEGDTVARDKAIEALLLAFDGVPQTGEKPYDEIYRGTWLQNYAAAYDWLHDQLTPDQDAAARALIAEEADYLRHNLTDGERLAPRPHNHRSKPAWGIGTAALVLSSDDRASDWLEYALWATNTVTRYQFSSDGIYREGGHYWMYNAVNFIPFLWHYKNVSGVDLFPLYRPAFEWPIRVRTSRGMIPNFEDSYLKPAPTHMVAAAYAGEPTDFHSSSDLSEVMQWGFTSAHLISSDYTGATSDVTWEIDEFILYDASITSTAPDRAPTVFLETGQVAFRNRWEGGVGSRSLLFHGVAEADNHNHPDQLAFFMESDDAVLIPDAGYGSDGFSDRRRTSWYLTNQAHNIITADGYAPRGTNIEQTPETFHYMDTPGFAFVEKRSLYGPLRDTSLRRAVAFIGGRYWVIADVMEATSSHTYKSYLHGRGLFEKNDNQLSWTTYPDKFGSVAKLDAFVYPAESNITALTGPVSLFKDQRTESYVEIEQTGEGISYTTLLIPGPSDAPSADVTDWTDDAGTVVAVAMGDTLDTFVVQAVPTATTGAGVESDGTFAWSRSIAGVLQGVAIREATYFRSADISVSIASPTMVSLDLSDPSQLRLTLGSDVPAQTLQVSGSSVAQVATVFMDGQQTAFTTSQSGDIEVLLAGSTGRYDHGDLPGSSMTGSAYPNPFEGSVTIRLEGIMPNPSRLEIFDILGRRVRVLTIDRAQGDSVTVQWDGRTENGSQVSSGQYFGRVVSLETGSGPVIPLISRN
jgi:hypothetical protein